MNLLGYLVRILIACVCGGAIGFERTKRLKEAGVRTHCIIAAASALMMIVSISSPFRCEYSPLSNGHGVHSAAVFFYSI